MLGAVRESGGWGEMATDEEIVDAIKLLARTEGIFAEPAGGTTLAVTLKLIAQGRIRADESVVVSITGNGYKTLEAVSQAVRTAVCDRGAPEGLRQLVRAPAGRQESPGRRGLKGRLSQNAAIHVG